MEHLLLLKERSYVPVDGPLPGESRIAPVCLFDCQNLHDFGQRMLCLRDCHSVTRNNHDAVGFIQACRRYHRR